MPTCDICQTSVTPQDLAQGWCPRCGATLTASQIALPQARLTGTLHRLAEPGPVLPAAEAPTVPRGVLAAPGKRTVLPPDASASAESGEASAWGILANANVRQSINPNDLPKEERTVLTSMLSGERHGAAGAGELSADISDTSLDESVLGPMDRTVDSTSVQPQGDQQSVLRESERGEDDESPSSWQGASGLVAESNLVIQRRTVITSVHEPDGAPPSDYQLVEMIGKGGMGTIWKARQYSIGRTVALKMIRVEKAHDREARERFLSEAVITGDLDHPNIVPVHDLGRFETDELFYAMRRITGQPWEQVMAEKTLSENLEIWSRVADAIAFAHSRGIIHRDIKPENVMVGGYGEVLVMDWGLAMPLPSFPKYTMIVPPTRSGGSPAYMAPEMAGVLLDQVGPWSDIYLLGATLYEIATGNPPHPGRTVAECIANARQNVIQPFSKAGKRTELANIALKAMSTRKEDRFASVQELQAAVHRWEDHQESLTLSEHAQVAVNRGREFGEYSEFARGVFGYEEALNRWDGNHAARQGLSDARLAYAECALKKHDYDLGLSLLEPRNPQHAPMLGRLKSGKHERDRRESRIRAMQRVVAGMAALLLIGAVGAAGVVAERNIRLNASLSSETEARQNAVISANSARESEAETKRALVREEKAKDALEKTNVSLTQSLKRESAARTDLNKANQNLARVNASLETSLKNETLAKNKATTNEELAKQREIEARQAETAARDSEHKEKLARFVAHLQLAATQIDQNAFTAARETLGVLKTDAYKDVLAAAGNEQVFRQLWSNLERGHTAVDGDTSLQALAVSPVRGIFATGSRDGRVQLWSVDAQGTPQAQGAPFVHRTRVDGKDGSFAPITGLSFSADGQWLASSAETRAVRIWNVETRQPAALLLHEDFVRCLRFAPEGIVLLTASGDAVRLWDAATGKELSVGRGHTGLINDAAFSSDGNTVLTAGDDQRVIVWRREGPRFERQAEFYGNRTVVQAVALSPDGRLAASAGNDGAVLLWDIEASRSAARGAKPGQIPNVPVLAQLQHHRAAVRSLAFAPGGALLISGSDDNTLCVWDVKSRTLQTTLRGHGNAVSDCAFLAGGSTVISVSSDSTARLWELAKYQEPNPRELLRVQELQQRAYRIDLRAHDGNVHAVAVNPSGTQAVTAARDGTAILWNTSTGERLRVFREGHRYLADKIAVGDAGRLLVTAAQDQSVCLWDADDGIEVQRLEGPGVADVIAVSADTRWLVTGGGERSVQLWDVPEILRARKGDARPAATFDLKAGPTAAALSADDRLLAVTTNGGSIVICDLSGQSVIRRFPGVSEPDDDLTGVAFLPDGTHIVTAGSDETATVWNVTTGKAVKSLPHELSLVGLSLSADGRHLATIGRPGSASDDRPQVAVWDLLTTRSQRNPRPLRMLATPGEVGIATAVSLSADGGVVAVAGTHADGSPTVARWLLADEKPTFLPLTAEDRGSALAIALVPGAKEIVTIGGDEARLWQWGEKPSVRQWYRPHRVLTAVDLSSDGQTLATGDMEGALKIWKVATGACLARLRPHADPITSVMFSPVNSAQLVTASDDRTAVVWSWCVAPASLQKLGELKGPPAHQGAVTRARFSADGKRIATACEDGVLRVWDAATRQLLSQYNHGSPLIAADLLGDGAYAVLADSTRVQLIDVARGQPLLSRPVSGHGRELTDVRFAGVAELDPDRPRRLRILTTSLDGTGKIWELATPRAGESLFDPTELLTLGRRGQTPGVTSVGLTRDASAIVTGHEDGHRLVWRAP